METKIFQVKQVDDTGQVSAVFATLNVIDHDEEVTRPGAFGSQEAVIVPTHDWHSVPLGKGLLRESNHEAIGDMKFNLEIPIAKEWHSALKFDLENGTPLQQWSYGFDVLQESKGEFEGRQVRFLEKLKVHEISPVLLGAGINTRTLAVKEHPDLEKIQSGFQVRRIMNEVSETLHKTQRIIDSEIYVQVDPSRVTRDQVALSAEILMGTASDNGIDAPRLCWFNEKLYTEAEFIGERFPKSFSNAKSSGGVRGLYDRGKNLIWIRSDLTGADLVRTVAHEVRHGAWNDPNSKQEERAQEQDARSYGEKIASVFPLNGARVHFIDEEPITGVTLKGKVNLSDWAIWKGRRYRNTGVSSCPIWHAWDL